MKMMNNAESTRSELTALLGAALNANPIVIADRKRATELASLLKRVAAEAHPFELLDALNVERREADRALAAARKGGAEWIKAADQIDRTLDEEEYINQLEALDFVFGSGWALVEDLAAARLELANRWIKEVTAAIGGRISTGITQDLARMSGEARA
jgi:hypothetical protein